MSEDWRLHRVDEIRSLIKQAEPDVVEEIKWRTPSNPDGVPAFSLDGLICTLEMYKGKVKVNFAKGARVDDPDGLFNASPRRQSDVPLICARMTSWMRTRSRR